MADNLSPKIRSKIMSSIKGKDTKPEMLVRKGLHALGYRFRLHYSNLPGRPDLVLKKYNAVIFVNGCFWHGHDCYIFKLPTSRIEFWEKKICKNKIRDNKKKSELKNLGWRIAVIWECSLVGKMRLDYTRLINTIAEWLESEVMYFDSSEL